VSLQQLAIIMTPFTASRALICSIPKSGTYLLGEILCTLGLRNTKIHLSRECYSDYSVGSREDHRRNPGRFTIQVPFDVCLPRIGLSAYALSHLAPDDRVLRACSNFRVFFLFRDIRDCAISYMRFLVDTGRDNAASSDWIRHEDGPARFASFLDTHHGWFVALATSVARWRLEPIALRVRFEDLVGDAGEAGALATVAAICRHLDIDPSVVDANTILVRCLNTPTLTSSGSRTERSRYWTKAVEERFEALGLGDINRELGYL